MNNPNEIDNNRKEEILAKSRKSNSDEGVEYIKKQGVHIGHIIAFFLIGLLSVMSALNSQMNTVWALGAVSSAFMVGEAYAKFRFTGKKSDLVKIVCAILVSLAFVFWFISETRGW